MDKFVLKVAGICLLIAFGLFFGMDTANRGIENVYGPIDPKPLVNTSQPDMEKNAADAPSNSTQKPDQTQPSQSEPPATIGTLPSDGSLHGVDKVVDKTGDVIHTVVDKGLRFIVAIGRALFE